MSVDRLRTICALVIVGLFVLMVVLDAFGIDLQNRLVVGSLMLSVAGYLFAPRLLRRNGNGKEGQS